MPKRGSIAKRQRPPVVKPRYPAVLKKKVKRDDADSIIGAPVSIGERELKFARALADTEERVRSASLISLRAWLEQNGSQLDDNQLDKLWMALFYCIWMADKRAVISAVIRDIVSLFDIVGWSYIRALFRCMVREWMGVDRHRVDKFYELLNVALRVAVAPAVRASSDEVLREKVEELVSCVCDVLIVNACKDGKGVLMHVLDRWVGAVLIPVLKKASTFSTESAHWAWDHLLEKLFPILKSTDERLSTVKMRLEERVIQELPTVIVSKKLKLPIRAKHDMLRRASKAVFAAAADRGIAEGERKRLYEVRTSMKVVIMKLKSDIENAPDKKQR